MSTIQYALSTPYPQVVGYVSPKEIAPLVNDYSGRMGETTAILQYIYQYYILDKTHPDIAHALEQIAIVEMRHHALLGKVIYQAGVDPIIASRTCFWSGSNLNYTKSVTQILSGNIHAEKLAIANYRRTLHQISNKSLYALVERIIQDEECHISVFEQLLDNLIDTQKIK